MAILLTGGAGFIGSHTAVSLLNAGQDIVIVDNLYNSSPKVIDRIERDLLNQDDLVATIHFDPVIASDSHVAELRSFLQQEVASLDTRANIHDLRIVPGPTHTNVIFDCAVPAEYITEKQRRGAKLAAALRAAVERKWPDHFCIIKLEPDYSAGIHETK